MFYYFQTVTLLIVSGEGIINGICVQGSPGRIVMLSIARQGGGVDERSNYELKKHLLKERLRYCKTTIQRDVLCR